jgi:hypothetical protein
MQKNDGEGSCAVKKFREEMTSENHSEKISCCGTEHKTDTEDSSERKKSMADGISTAGGYDEFENHDGQDRADGIDDDAFPPEDIGYRHGRTNGPEHRGDDRRSGNHRDRSEQEGQSPGEMKDPSGCNGSDQPGDGNAEGDHPPYDGFKSDDLAVLEGEASLEKD